MTVLYITNEYLLVIQLDCSLERTMILLKRKQTKYTFRGNYYMNELTTKDMTEYLKNAMKLESSIYRQKQAIEAEEQKLKYAIPQKKEAIPPYKRKLNEPQKPTGSSKTMTFWGIFCGIVFLVFGFVTIVSWLKSDSIFFLSLGVISAFLAISLFCSVKKIKSDYEEYKKAYHNYESEMEKNEKDYKDRLEKYEIKCVKVEEEYNEQIKAYHIAESALKQLDKPLSETQQILEKLYSADIIFPKYRNMVAMCTIYEYFAAGRCTELNGADGAYNLYESELRQNLIINRLDTIIEQLDEIKANQYTLYTELKKTNEILEGISSDMKELTSTVHRIEDATHITAYCAQVTAQNTEALKYITLING